jgi:competence protein ComEC
VTVSPSEHHGHRRHREHRADGPWTVPDRDPWSPDAIRRRRGAPDLRLVPAALVAWAAVALTVLLRSPVPTTVVAATAVLLAVGLRCLGPDRGSRGPGARWVDRYPVRTLVRTATVVPLMAAAWSLRAWQCVRSADHHPWMSGAAGGTTVQGDFTVVSAPRQVRGGGLMTDIDVPGLGHVPVFLGGRYQPDIPVTGLLDLQPGTRLQISGTVRADDRPGVAPLTVSVDGAPDQVHGPEGIRALTGHLRAALREAASHLPGNTGDLVPGMIVGDTGRLPEDTRTDFLATGLSHLMAVSGANVAIVTGAVLVAAAALKVGKRGRVCAAAVSLILFVLIVGPEPSVLRAAVMGSVGLVAVASARRTHGFAACSAAVLLLLLVDPGLAVDYAFVLSVAATVGIVALAPWISRRLLQAWARRLTRRGHAGPAHWQLLFTRTVGVSLAADVVTAPVVAHMSGVVSPTALLANLVVGPVVGPLTVVGMAGALLAGVWVPAGAVVLWGSAPPAWWILTVAEHLAQVPVLHTPGGWWSALALLPVAVAVVAVVVAPRIRGCALATLGICVAVGVVLWRTGTVTVGPYDDEVGGPGLTRRWAEDLDRTGEWDLGVRMRDGRPELLSGDGAEHGHEVIVVRDDREVLQAERAGSGRAGEVPPRLYVVTSCGRSRGMPSMTPGGVPVAYPCRDGTVLLAGDGLHADGRPL